MYSNDGNNNNNSDPFETFTSGINLLLISATVLFAVIVVMIVLLIKYRSKKIKKKNSICEPDVYPSVETGILTAGVVPIKINKSNGRHSSDISDTSDDVLYDSERRYVVDRVQPKRCSLRTQKSVSSMDSDLDTVPSLVLSVKTDGKAASVALLKANNLRRSGISSNDKLIPEGVFARIYPKTRYKRMSSQESESSQTDCEQRYSSEEYFETHFVKSKKSKSIKFDENEMFVITEECFPIRISVYDLDKQKVRYNIGHCFLNISARDNIQTTQIIELDLFSTIYKARNSCLSNN